MTNFETGVGGLCIAWSVMLLWVAYAWVLKPAIYANWQQDLYRVRNAAWLEMHRLGTLDSPAHVRLRSTINLLIANGKRVNLSNLAVCFLCRSRPEVTAPVPYPPGPAGDHLRQADDYVVRLLLKRICFHQIPVAMVTLCIVCTYATTRIGLEVPLFGKRLATRVIAWLQAMVVIQGNEEEVEDSFDKSGSKQVLHV